MKCVNCGNELHYGEKFCARCGIQSPDSPVDYNSVSYTPNNPTGYQPATQPTPVPAPAAYYPAVQPMPAPAGHQPTTQPPPTPAGYQPAVQPMPAPAGHQPTTQPPPTPAGYQPATQPTPAPAAYHPAVQPMPAPAAYQPTTQTPPAPAVYQPATQPPPAPAGYPPATPAQYPAAPIGYQPETQPPGAPAGNYPGTNSSEAKSGIFQKLKGIPLKRILSIAIPAVIIVVALIIAIPLIIHPGGFSMTNSISLFEGDGEVLVSYNNDPRFTISGDLHSSQRSIDGGKAAILTDNRDNRGGTLWFVTTSGSARIAEDVLTYQISDSGNGVVFFTDYSSKNDTASLYLYDTQAKKASLITEDAPYFGYSDMTGVCISPNGKTIGFASNYDQYHDEFTGYVSIDGKAAEKLGKNSAAVAVSDGGRYIYYIKNYDGYSGSLNVRSGNNDNKLISDFNTYIYLSLNKDYSQIFFNYQDKSYLSQGGSEKAKIGNSTISDLLVPRGTQKRIVQNFYTMITVYGISSFIDQVAYSDDGLVYINKSLETNKISSSSTYANSARISNNGKILLFISNTGHLSAIDPTNPNAGRREVARNVQEFVATGDATSIYYVNEDDELFYIKGNGQPVKISDDVSNHLVLPYNSAKAFFLVDYSDKRGGELYFSDKGGRRVKVPGADEVMELWSTPANLFFQSYDNEIFRSNGNEMFIRFAEDVSR